MATNPNDIKVAIKLLLEDKEALNSLSKALNSVKNENEKAVDFFSQGWVKATAVVGTVVAATEGLRRVMAAAIAEASAQEDAINRLNLALRNQGIFTVQLSAQYQQMADKLQMASRFSDEAILEVQQRLVTIGNVAPAAMERVTKAVLDLATANKLDLSTASLVVAKAIAGKTEALSRYGIMLESNIPKAERTEAILRKINDTMGGAAAADASTFAGAQEKVAKGYGEVLESLGRFVTKSPTIQAAMKGVADELFRMAEGIEKFRQENPDAIADTLKKNTDVIQGFASGGIFGVAEKMGERLGKTLFENIFGSPEDNQAKAQEVAAVVESAAMSASEQAAILRQREAEREMEEQILKEQAMRESFIKGEVQKIDQLRMIWDQWNNEKTAAAMAAVQAENDFLTLAIQTQQLAHESMWKTVGKLRDQFSSGISGMFKDMIRGTFNAEEAFKRLGLSMLDILIDYGVQLAVNLALSKAFSATQVAVSTTTAGLVAAAWAPAAAAASLATLGSNASAATAALVQTHALSRALAAVPGLWFGGIVRQAGLTLVGEKGPEILDMPAGARVTPLDHPSVNPALNSGSGQGQTGNIQINIEINNPQFAPNDLEDQIVERVGPKLSKFIQDELRIA